MNKSIVAPREVQSSTNANDIELSDPQSIALNRSLSILMIGPALTQNGGMASVEKLILAHVPPQVHVLHVCSHDEGSALYRARVYGVCFLQYLFALLFQRHDLVYFHMSEGGSFVRKGILAWLAFRLGKKVVLHNHTAEFLKSYRAFPRLLQHQIDRLFQQCTRVIALSQSWKDCFVETCGVSPDRVLVMTNPTELPVAIPDRSERITETVRLLFCGRVGDRKGTFDLIDAIQLLPIDLRNLTSLVIAGDGELDRAREKIRSLKLENVVTLVGWIDAAKREQLLAQSDVFVLPSYNEGLPMAILEAMGWGLPIVSTQVGGIPELVISGKNGLLLKPGQIEVLSESLATLIRDRELRLQLGLHAKQSVQSYDIRTYWDGLLSCFL
ncbi:MAG TPA: glycosyltransferase family 4 protein, partial [Pirellula sp.]|nr:glycosyltransferase family 4 protein [Pirellula sp.]